MSIHHEDVFPVLESLIEKCRGLEAHYAQTARCVSERTRKARCIFLRQERAQLVQDLADKLRSFGGSVELSELAADESWDSFFPALTPQEQDDLLAESAEGDEEMVIEYDRALRLPLPIDVRMMLMRHRMQLTTREKTGLLDQLVRNKAHLDILAQATRN
jgi:hypothetical protein